MSDDALRIEVGSTTKTALRHTKWALKKIFWFIAYVTTALVGLAVLISPLVLGLDTVPADMSPVAQITQIALYVVIWHYTARPLGMKILNSIKSD